MNSQNANFSPERPALRWFGGKWLLAPWVISHFPKHRIYVEPFGGAASVLLQKERSYAEVYNDIFGDVVNYFRVLQDRQLAAEFERRVRLTPFAREEFEAASTPHVDPIERARRMLIRSFMGFGSASASRTQYTTGFRASSNRSGTTPAHDWQHWPDSIAALTERLQGVVIENRDAREVMGHHDSAETLHYVDPPYIGESRSEKHGYQHDMTDEADHEELYSFLKSLRGSVVFSGYNAGFYQRIEWKRIEWKRIERKTFADGARERVECLWLNPRAEEMQTQGRLF